ncbi:MBOAT family protein [Sphingomonas sp. LHG3406-1]|uniref:MBOAT family O-acyltransferase n=1 Tax=Sphingomonas sp. LHG3406-1 TaxID=2804617 RepID=UPI00262B1AA6|nr:MBOAT family O-acyltransferase [Sphingomonas sp. LHG3406-1]
MIFNSLTFVLFFAVVLALHNAPFGWRQKKINLLLASYLFYAAWNPPFIILLWVSTVVDWWAAQWMVRARTQGTRRAWMIVSVVVNLGMLSYFKYGEFLLQNFVTAAAAVGVVYQPPAWDIILPVGISFYTFATLSYTLDIYLRRAEPATNFLDYALFVTFFPHLVAGPIMRPTELVPQFEQPRRANAQMVAFGFAMLTIGLFQKVVIADGLLAPVSEGLFDRPGVPLTLDAWAGVLAFAGQIFCDFAGYSTSAIGIALTLGFAMPDNFRFPYGAVGFSDFWRRWHITLSSWLRDYLYIPLGGNRHGPARTYMALMGTMLLGGLWHGAAWTFVVWGGLHGTYLAVERMLKSRFGDWKPSKAQLFGLAFLTFLAINVTWVFFRAQDFTTAGTILASMAGHAPGGAAMMPGFDLAAAFLVMGAIFLIHFSMRDTTLEAVLERTSAWVLAPVLGLMAFLVIIEQGRGNAFIYFAF